MTPPSLSDYHAPPMQNIHIVRVDGVNHGVVSLRRDLKRATHTICGIRLAANPYQHRPGGYPHTVMTCDTDIAFVNAMADLDEGGP